MVRFVSIAAVCTALLSVSAHGQQADFGECSVEPGISSETHDVLFSVGGTELRETDLPAALQQALFDAELQYYKKHLEIIDSAVLDLELQRRAGESGKPRDVVARELLAVARPDSPHGMAGTAVVARQAQSGVLAVDLRDDGVKGPLTDAMQA